MPEGKSSLITSVLRGFGSALYEPSIASTFSGSESGLGWGDNYPDQYTFDDGSLDHLNVTGTLTLLSVLCESVSQAEHTVTME